MPLAIIAQWMYHSRLRRLIVSWFRRSQGESVSDFDVFDRFTSLWISFNAWLTYESKKDNDRNRIEWAKVDLSLCSKYSELIKDDVAFKVDANALQTLCPISRNRSYKGSSEVRISNVNNFGEVLEAIYVIRCNFFHGSKSPDDARDLALTELALRILSKVFSARIDELSSSDW